MRYSQRTISVGRDPASDLRFDPEADRAVSARHALLFFEHGRWHVRDLDSRNGTLLNGHRVRGDAPLRDGDRITFGGDGPTVELHLAHAAGEALEGGSGARHALRKRAAALLSAALLVVLLVALYLGARQRVAWNRERAAMRLQIDSLQGAGSRAVAALEQQLVALTASLRRSEEQVRALQAALASAESSGEHERARGLRRELQVARVELHSQQKAAALDFRAIQQRNRHAVARIFVEFGEGEVVTGTAFAVRPDATLVTSRHVVAGEDGRRLPRRIAIQFSDSEQVWPARLLGVSRDGDVAVVKVDNILGEVPTIRALNLRPDTLPPGAPVAMIGFPRGGAAARPDEGGFARPSLSAGVIRSVTAGQIEVEGYGAVGASGSPILDANGEVVAVTFGGRSSPTDHALFGIPARLAAGLLAALR